MDIEKLSEELDILVLQLREDSTNPWTYSKEFDIAFRKSIRILMKIYNGHRPIRKRKLK